MNRNPIKGEVSTRLIVALAVIGVLVVAAVPLGFYVYPAIKKLFEKPGPRVGVVRTVAELKELTPFELPDGAKVRLGISSDECYLGGCIMVYSHIEGNVSVINESPKGRCDLGPLSYDVYKKGKRFLRLAKHIKGLAKVISGFYYNTVTTTYMRKGEYFIEFYDWENKIIANASFTARRPAPHPWQDFQYERVSSNSFVITGIGNRSIAVPDSESGMRCESIPAVLPRVPFDSRSGKTGDLKLAGSGKGFQLTSDKPFTGPFHRRMLARFWINDKPVVSTPDNKLHRLLSGSFKSLSFTSLCFEINLDYKANGIKPGDTIKMQLMYAPSYKIVKTYEKSRMEKLITLSRDSGIRISNTLEFTCP